MHQRRQPSNPGLLTPTALVAIFLILALVAGLSYRQWTEHRRAGAAAAHSRQILETVSNLLARLLDAETGQRGFLLTGETRYLQPYTSAVGQVPVELAALERLMSQGKDADLPKLKGLVDRKLGELARGIESRRAQGAAAAVEVMLREHSNRTMNEIREVWSGIRSVEYAALSKGPPGAESVAQIALLVAVGALLILTFFLFSASSRTGDLLIHSSRTSALPGYAVAVAATVAATLIRFALTPFLGEHAVPFITYFPAVLLAAWYGTFGAASLAILLSGLMASYFFIAPVRTFWIPNPADQVAFLIFAVVGFGTALLGSSQKQALLAAESETARRRAAEAAEAAEHRRLLTTLKSIGDAVLATDAGGRIVLANRVAQDLLRGREADLIGRPLDDVFRIVNEDTRATVESPVARVLREGAAVGLANHTILIALDGTEIPIDDSAAPVRLDDGPIQGVVLVFRDITERRQGERSTAFFEALVASSDDGIAGKTPDGIVQSWNAGAERLYGYSAAEMVGRPMTDLIPPDRVHEEAEILERLRAGELVSHLETVRRRRNGSLVDVSLTFSPIRDRSGEIVGVSHVARDITEQKRNAETLRESQKMESLGILAGGIAHDFNNLLTGILGNASLVLEDLAGDARARHRIEDVIQAGERAAQLTGQMLAYSGKGRFVVEKVDLSAKVSDMTPLLQAAIPRTVELRLDLENGLPPVEADCSQLQQLLTNLIVNGAEAIREGEAGAIEILTRRLRVDAAYMQQQPEVVGGDLRPGEYVLLEVRDSGSGMDQATRKRIFDPFFSTKFIGRGLGLAAVLGIVRAHGGCIAVSSMPGQGTVFRVWLPAAEPAPAPAAKARQEAPERAGAGTILVVDDEEVVRKVAKAALERHGYTVIQAENGAEGVAVFGANAARIRCVVLDLTMPVMSGEEALRRIQELRPDVPVILSSGFKEAEALRRFEGLKLAGFLQKPYRAATLAAKITHVLGGEAIPTHA
jgi:PAS domain S-box-containing protein